MSSRLVFGVGIRDTDHAVQVWQQVTSIDGKLTRKLVWVCPYYVKWKSMLKRCYSKSHLAKHPTYESCHVCPEWFYLSNFIKWVDKQPNRGWINCSLDKDLLFEGNKTYSPDTCVFVDPKINTFVIDCGASRGEHMLGVSFHKRDLSYTSRCCDPFKLDSGFLGYFDSELEAHLAWKAKKHEYACRLADTQEDVRVADILRNKYSSDKDLTCK